MKGGQGLQLEPEGKPESCDFTLHPRYKFRQVGEQVLYGDHFTMFHHENDMYMKIEDEPQTSIILVDKVSENYRTIRKAGNLTRASVDDT